jgi:probable HAF family extracellular repeat protein
LWENNTVIDLGTFGGISASVRDINNNGDMVGYFVLPSGERHGFLWSDGIVTDLSQLIGLGGTITDINDNGSMVINVDGQQGYLLEPIPEPTTLLHLGLIALVLWRKDHKPR